MTIKINTIIGMNENCDNLWKSWYYDLEPIIKLSENKSL